MIPIAYNIRSLRLRRSTTVAAALGLALVVFVFASALMLANGIKATTQAAADPNVAVLLRRGSSNIELQSAINLSSVGVVGALPGVARFSDGRPEVIGEVTSVVLMAREGAEGSSTVQIRGISDDTMAFRPGARIIAGRAAKPGTDEVVVGRAIRGRFKGLELGSSFNLRTNHPMKVVGVFEDDGSMFESEVWCDSAIVRSTFGRGENVSSIRVRLTSPDKFDAFKASVESSRLNLTVARESDFFESASHGIKVFLQGIGFLIALFFSIGAVIGAMITMHATIAQRQREIGTLLALGFTGFQILVAFLIESLALALAGGVVGAVTSLALSFVHISMLNNATFSELVFRFQPSVGIVVSAMAVAGVMGVAAGFLPAVRAARMNPSFAMRGA